MSFYWRPPSVPSAHRNARTAALSSGSGRFSYPDYPNECDWHREVERVRCHLWWPADPPSRSEPSSPGRCPGRSFPCPKVAPCAGLGHAQWCVLSPPVSPPACIPITKHGFQVPPTSGRIKLTIPTRGRVSLRSLVLTQSSVASDGSSRSEDSSNRKRPLIVDARGCVTVGFHDCKSQRPAY